MTRNTRGKNYSAAEKASIRGLAKSGYTDRQIAEALRNNYGRETSEKSVATARRRMDIANDARSLDRLPIRKPNRNRVAGGFRQHGACSVKIAVMFPPEQYLQLDALAQEMNVSFASVVRMLCNRALNDHPKMEAAQ